MGSTQTKDDNGTIKKRRGRVKYKVTVKTNDVVYGGSDGVVQIKIVGDLGSTRIYTLNNWYDGFEKDSKFCKKRWESSKKGACPSGHNY